jgi:hypothetical protein
MIIAHKIALDPNEAQEGYFARACGTARFAYNWALGMEATISRRGEAVRGIVAPSAQQHQA